MRPARPPACPRTTRPCPPCHTPHHHSTPHSPAHATASPPITAVAPMHPTASPPLTAKVLTREHFISFEIDRAENSRGTRGPQCRWDSEGSPGSRSARKREQLRGVDAGCPLSTAAHPGNTTAFQSVGDTVPRESPHAVSPNAAISRALPATWQVSLAKGGKVGGGWED